MSAKYIVALLPLLAPLVAAETATFTHYGSGDSTGSQNCANPPADRPLACGAGTTNVQGYTAAISQNDYGAGPGQGAGPGCGECWTLTITGDENGNPVPQRTVNVTINNLCPAQGNEEWCDIPAGGTNQHGGQVHFDICSDNGGSEAFFTSVGAGKGTATKIDCGSGNAAESSSAAAPSSTAQPTSPASSAPVAASSYTAATSSAAASQGSSAPSSSSGSSGSGSSGSGSSGSGSGSPYQGSSPSSAAAASGASSAPHYKPSLHSHPVLSFPFPIGGSTAAGATGSPVTPGSPYGATPTPGHHHHHGGFPGFPGSNHGQHLPGSPYGPQPQKGAGGEAQGSSGQGSPSVSAAAAEGSTPAGGAGGDECEEGKEGGSGPKI